MRSSPLTSCMAAMKCTRQDRSDQDVTSRQERTGLVMSPLHPRPSSNCLTGWCQWAAVTKGQREIISGQDRTNHIGTGHHTIPAEAAVPQTSHTRSGQQTIPSTPQLHHRPVSRMLPCQLAQCTVHPTTHVPQCRWCNNMSNCIDNARHENCNAA